jgi:hypothetical protein
MNFRIAIRNVAIHVEENIGLVVRSGMVNSGLRKMLEQSIELCNAFDVQAGMASILIKDNSIGSES